MAEIQYDPACVRCRIDAGRDVAGTTWQCHPHVQAERDSLRLALETATRERDEARAGEAKWRRELDAAIELSERSREIVKAALNQPPEYFYDHHDNGEWSAEHIAHAIRCLFAERDALLARLAAPPADAATEVNGYPPTLADARMHIERLTRSLSQPHSADERFFAINEARTWLAKTAATKADAATEAVREAYRGLMLFPYGSPLHRKGMQRLCAALDAALSPAPAPSTDPWRACGCPNPDDCEHVFLAPAPSAKEGRT